MKPLIIFRISLTVVCALAWPDQVLSQTAAEPRATAVGESRLNEAEAPSATAPQNEENLVHFGDLIDVDVIGSYEYDWRGTLNAEGFLGGVDFAEEPIFGLCRTEEQIARDVARGYGKLLRDPQVAVKILDRSRRATTVLDGAVRKPQRFQIKRAVRLNEILIIAGGLTERASGEVKIFRPGNLSCVKPNAAAASATAGRQERFVKTVQADGSQTVSIKISDLLSGDRQANPQVLSGDIITVTEADPVYVTGGVNSPKRIALRSALTLSRAIDSAGGLAKAASGNDVVIFRREGRETKVIEASLAKIKAGQAEDITLKGFDVIEVGSNGRERSKYPPMIQTDDADDKDSAGLPLRVID